VRFVSEEPPRWFDRVGLVTATVVWPRRPAALHPRPLRISTVRGPGPSWVGSAPGPSGFFDCRLAHRSNAAIGWCPGFHRGGAAAERTRRWQVL